MNLSWAEIKKSLLQFWDKLSRPQKIIAVLAPLLVASSLIVLIVWASRPEYVSIFTKLSDSEAGAIKSKLTELKVDYRLADNGASIQVPQKQAAEVRLELANAGLPESSKFSFDNIDQLRLGETDADRKLRYVLGLQDELETTLKTLTGVTDARVHIVMPEPSLFAEKEEPATAGVTLKLVPGTKVTEDQVRAIAKLLASSIEGLKPENVTIVDTSGNTLSDIISQNQTQAGLSATQLQLQQTVEENIQKSVQSMLDKVLGSGKAVVRVNAVLDFDQIKITEQTNGPGAVLSRQNTSENTTNNAQTGAVPGTDTNIPTYQAAANAGTSTSTKTSNTENFQVDTRQEERVVNPGAIKRLSVSVLADETTVGQDQINKIQTVVTSAAGIDQDRGDQIRVEAIPFDRTGLEAEKNAFALAELKRQILFYALGGAVILGLILLLIYWRSRVKAKKSKIAMESDLVESQIEKTIEETPVGSTEKRAAEEIENQKIRESVEQYAIANPDEAARILKTWLSEDE
ncbi:MAG TPA: flagellar basal-body MS-ring/collar protein FliF [Desulfitobacteriaceae bacterium]|jgi:flagellar M-ring protein FliF|nr:flagellar basal-body MS-ring/collar protein FliF [Desulfitobacteriaceae bacterium]